MKKLLICFALLFLASTALADVQIIRGWNQSATAVAGLDRQEVIYDGTIKATPAFANPGDPHTYQWTETGVNIADVIGKDVVVRTYNDQGAYVDETITIGGLPAPATGGYIQLLQVP